MDCQLGINSGGLRSLLDFTIFQVVHIDMYPICYASASVSSVF